jgi:hypothetical protein
MEYSTWDDVSLRLQYEMSMTTQGYIYKGTRKKSS